MQNLVWERNKTTLFAFVENLEFKKRRARDLFFRNKLMLKHRRECVVCALTFGSMQTCVFLHDSLSI